MPQYIKANLLPFCPRPQMGKIFAEGFYDHGLKFFCNDTEKLGAAMEHIFLLEHFYAAVEGEEILAMIGVKDKKPPPVKLNKKILIRELGFFRGRLAFWGMNKFLVNNPYPFEMGKNTGSIEFVATSSTHRGKGIAEGLLSHIMEIEPFDEYVLEVVDNNAPAIRLYEKLGFKEFKRTPSPSKNAGFDFFIYMRKEEKA
ncbi:MAG: GNAT family N-acetyltransferase [Defluviitaleaceae bacterium]|nr:GNAT family N-acetyltransferase [Defluviitaleaceae bacterium]